MKLYQTKGYKNISAALIVLSGHDIFCHSKMEEVQDHRDASGVATQPGCANRRAGL